MCDVGTWHQEALLFRNFGLIMDLLLQLRVYFSAAFFDFLHPFLVFSGLHPLSVKASGPDLNQGERWS